MNLPAIDTHAVDTLIRLFAECRELGITVPDGMPLDTPYRQRCAVHYLDRLVYAKRREASLRWERD